MPFIFGLALPALLAKISTALTALKAFMPFLEKLIESMKGGGDSASNESAANKQINDKDFKEALNKAGKELGVDASKVTDLKSLIDFLKEAVASNKTSKDDDVALNHVIAALEGMLPGRSGNTPAVASSGLQPPPGGSA
jgi:hypothetical protein